MQIFSSPLREILEFFLRPLEIEDFFRLVRRVLNFTFFLAAAFFCFFSSIVSAQLQRNDSERQLFEFLNRERAAQGLPALQWDNALFKAARRHALLMLDLNMVEHQLPNEPGLEARL